MTLAEQIQAQIAFNKVLPLIQTQLTNNSFALIDYQNEQGTPSELYAECGYDADGVLGAIIEA